MSMHIREVHRIGGEEEQKIAEEFLSTVQKDKLKREIESIVDTEFDRLKDYAQDYISDQAACRAEHFIESVLRGEDDAARRLLGDRYGCDRHRVGGCDDGKPWASVMHGRIFETGGVEIRRKIVEAHADLLKDERAKDLEATVEGLRMQICELQRRLDERHGGWS